MRRPALTVAGALVLAALLALPALAAGGGGVTYSCSPAPEDCTGWYRQPVRITWAVPDGYNTIGCDNWTYAEDTTGTANRCQALNGASKLDITVTLHVDQTPPAVTGATPARPPDHDGWYTAPVDVAFSGTDATSGIASCQTITYAGPDGPDASVAGTCTDVAGNVSAPLALGLKYDATPPAVKLRRTDGDRQVRLRWSASPDTVRVTIARTDRRHRRGARMRTVFAGTGRTFTDRHVANGRRYDYRVTAVDAAGNTTVVRRKARPGRRLLGPPAGAPTGDRTPLLRWTPVRGASYYNVQVFRGATKILSRWPKRARYQLGRLRRGTYTWYVWPGRGRLSEHRYGQLIGKRTFVVR